MIVVIRKDMLHYELFFQIHFSVSAEMSFARHHHTRDQSTSHSSTHSDVGFLSHVGCSNMCRNRIARIIACLVACLQINIHIIDDGKRIIVAVIFNSNILPRIWYTSNNIFFLPFLILCNLTESHSLFVAYAYCSFLLQKGHDLFLASYKNNIVRHLRRKILDGCTRVDSLRFYYINKTMYTTFFFEYEFVHTFSHEGK